MSNSLSPWVENKIGVEEDGCQNFYVQKGCVMPYGPYGPGPWGWGWMVGGWIMMLLFLGLLIAGIVVLVRALTGRSMFAQPSYDSALEVLRRRYAAGEITKDQFEEMKRTLG